MNAQLQKLLERKMTRKNFIKATFLLFVSSFALYGVIEELLSNAATPSGSTEADKGTRTGSATVVANSAFADGNAVKFGTVPSTSSTGTGTTTTSIGSMVPSGPTGTFSLAWHDEFDDTTGMSGPTNGLQNKKWNIGWDVGPSTLGGTGNQTTTTKPANSANGNYHSPATVKLPGDDNLHLQGVAGSWNGYNYDCGSVGSYGLWALNPRSIALSSELQTAVNAGEITVVNGEQVIEFRVRWPGPSYDSGNLVSGASSWWPVIWTGPAGNFGSSSGWGADWPGGLGWNSEIDIWEFYHAFGDNTGLIGNACTLGLPATTGGSGIGNASYCVSMPPDDANIDMSLAFHTHTMHVDASGNIALYVDGTLVNTTGGGGSGGKSGTSTCAGEMPYEWSYPQWITIAMQSHTTVPPNTTATGNNDMMIDYVRIWTVA